MLKSVHFYSFVFVSWKQNLDPDSNPDPSPDLESDPELITDPDPNFK